MSSKQKVKAAVYSSVNYTAREAVDDSVWNAVSDSVAESVGVSIRRILGEAVADSASVGDSITTSVYSKLESYDFRRKN
jgi:hypothetical protein